MKYQKEMVDIFNNHLALIFPQSVYGYVKGRSAKLMAEVHRNQYQVIKMDIKDFFEKLTATWAALIFFATFFYPDVIYGGALRDLYNGNALTHTTLFHLLVCLCFLLIIGLRPYNMEIKKVWYAPIGILGYGAVASTATLIFSTFTAPEDMPNYCSIYKPHSFGFTIDVFNKFGYGLYLPLIAVIGCVGATLFYLAIVAIYKIIDLINCRKGFFIGMGITVVSILPSALIIREIMHENWIDMLYLPILLVLIIIPSIVSILVTKKLNCKREINE